MIKVDDAILLAIQSAATAQGLAVSTWAKKIGLHGSAVSRWRSGASKEMNHIKWSLLRVAIKDYLPVGHRAWSVQPPPPPVEHYLTSALHSQIKTLTMIEKTMVVRYIENLKKKRKTTEVLFP